MYILLLGIIIFFGLHLVPSVVSFRGPIVRRLGERKYTVLYSILALIGLVLIIYGMATAEYKPIWKPHIWSRKIVIIAMLFSFYLFAAADMKSNIKRYLRHPMLLGILLWSTAHLFANGDLASCILFGSFAIFSLFGMISANRRGAILQKEKYPITKDILSVIAGLIGYTIFVLFVHPYIIGIPVI